MARQHKEMGFRTKLTISYIVLIAIPVAIVSLGYYQRSAEIILQTTRVNFLSVLNQSNELINSKFVQVENRARDLHTDRRLYEYFNTPDVNNHENASENDDIITGILNSYFPRTEDIYTVNLITSEYTYGLSPSLWIPKSKFSGSQIYITGQMADNNLIWMPPYDLLDALKIREDEKLELKRFDEIIFTATRKIEFATIENNMLQRMDIMRERPVLAVHFKEEMLSDIFSDNTSTEGSYYYVLTENGQVVSKSQNADTFEFEDLAWLNQVYGNVSGTSLANVKGEKMLVCYDIIDTTGWISLFFVPYESLVKPLPQMLFFGLMLTLIVILLAVVIAVIISRRITGPINMLLKAIRHMREGDFDIGTNKVKTGEFKYLFSKFYEMSERLDRLIRENYQVKINEQEAQIKALYFQFNPHFLYNTLNVINWMAIDNDQDEISDMLVRLSDILEYTAKNENTIVSLEDELDYMRSYVFLMSKRFIGRFEVSYDMNENLMEYPVPKFFMQPFIENAILHGFSDTEKGGLVEIKGWIEEDFICFSIEDNGKGIEPETLSSILEDDKGDSERKSVGIRIIHQRIRKLYGMRYGVEIQSVPGEGTKVIIRLPKMGMEEAEHEI